MPTYIPEWAKATAREQAIKRALQSLEAGCVVRRPLRVPSDRPPCPADFFVQRDDGHWLAVTVESAPFEQLDPSQLFDSPQRNELARRLAAVRAHGTGGHQVQTLVLLWGCSTNAEAACAAAEYIERFGVHAASRDQFIERGAALVDELLAPVPQEMAQSLMLAYFPEAEVPAECTTRRFTPASTGAQLVRHFLDHEQEWAAKLDLDMPDEQAQAATDLSVRLINGVAGSGKTLILLQRAMLLAKLFPQQRVQVLIHNAPVVADTLHRLHRVHGPLPGNLDVSTFFAWATAQWDTVFGRRPRLAKSFQLDAIIRPLAMRQPGPGLDARQLADEFDFIDSRLIATEADYLAASRAGRGFALRNTERAQVFALHAEYEASLRRQGLRTWADLTRGLCLSPLELRQRMVRCQHLLVDEAQFFAPSWFHLVKMVLLPGGLLFLCADPAQGFLKHRLSWKGAGLDVSGRTRRLRRSYRTTRAILRAAQGVLAGLALADDEDVVQPDLADMEEGCAPLLLRTRAWQDNPDQLVKEIEAVRQQTRLPLSAMLVLYGAHLHDSVYERLCRQLSPTEVWAFNKESQRRSPPPGAQADLLRMASVESATGLEAAVVFLVGIEDLLDEVPPLDLPDGEKAAWKESQARKLYMAMTRAGRQLVVISSRPLPQRLQPLFEQPGTGRTDGSRLVQASTQAVP